MRSLRSSPERPPGYAVSSPLGLTPALGGCTRRDATPSWNALLDWGVADYREHQHTGIGWWLVASLGIFLVREPLGLSHASALLIAAVGLPASLMGATFPDVDLASSIPHRRFRAFLFVLVSLLSLYPLLTPRAVQALAAALGELGYEPALAPAAAWLLAGLCGALAIAVLAVTLPRHRGLTHHWPAALLLAAALGAAVYVSLPTLGAPTAISSTAGLATAGFFLLGFGSHLFKDGLLTHRSRKRR